MNADKTLLTPLCKRLGATLSRRGMLFVGLGIVIIMSAAALLAPWLSPYDPTALHLKSILVPPSAQFPLGMMPWAGMCSHACFTAHVSRSG